MPLRSVKIYFFIFGFQRRVWCPKCTPASNNCFIEITAIIIILLWFCFPPNNSTNKTSLRGEHPLNYHYSCVFGFTPRTILLYTFVLCKLVYYFCLKYLAYLY